MTEKRGGGAVFGCVIMRVLSVPAAFLSTFSHYPSGALTVDFSRGRFISKEQKSPVTFVPE